MRDTEEVVELPHEIRLFNELLHSRNIHHGAPESHEGIGLGISRGIIDDGEQHLNSVAKDELFGKYLVLQGDGSCSKDPQEREKKQDSIIPLDRT